MKKKILFANGPNLGLLGVRQPEIYGSQTLAEIEDKLHKLLVPVKINLESIQSNHEGELLDFFNEQFLKMQDKKIRVSGIIVNPGAFTHTRIALRDALEMYRAVQVPLYEVHISNVFAREQFRHYSYLSSIASGVVCGLGTFGYLAACQKILELDSSLQS